MAYLTTKRWVKERLQEWGQDHQLWDSRVMGNFPHQSDDASFSLTWLEEAKARTEGDGELFAGLDVGGPGEDETCPCVCRGPKIVLLKAWTQADPWGSVVAALNRLRSAVSSQIPGWRPPPYPQPPAESGVHCGRKDKCFLSSARSKVRGRDCEALARLHRPDGCSGR